MHPTMKTALGLGLLGAFAVACGSADSNSTATNQSSVSASVVDAGVAGAEFVFLQGSSSGYTVAPLNGTSRGATVTSLSLGATGVDLDSLQSALAVPQSVAAAGTVQGDVFVASAIYETLPGVVSSVGDSFYAVQPQGPGGVATELNTSETGTQSRTFGTLDLDPIQVPYLDTVWLSARIMDGTAVVAGSFEGEGSSAPFDVSAVYLKLPDTTKCPQPAPACPEGGEATYTRDANRCLIAAGCTSPKPCPEFVPVCPAGSTLASWTGTNGCHTFQCDPTFDPAPTM